MTCEKVTQKCCCRNAARRDISGREYTRLPAENAPAWYALKFSDRALGLALVHRCGGPIIDEPFTALPDAASRLLAVDGRERQHIRRAIHRIADAGLIVADGRRSRVLYSAGDLRDWQGASHV